jgi:hypothetical protein
MTMRTGTSDGKREYKGHLIVKRIERIRYQTLGHRNGDYVDGTFYFIRNVRAKVTVYYVGSERFGRLREAREYVDTLVRGGKNYRRE